MCRLRLTIELPLKDSDLSGVSRLIANHLVLTVFESAPEVRVLSSTGVTRRHQSYDPARLPPEPPPTATLRPLPSPTTGLPRCPYYRSDVLCPLPRRTERLHVSIASPSVRPSPNFRRVGVRTFNFEACSGFTSITARRIARPPKGGLCHEASFRTVARPSRSSATRPIDNYLGGIFLHW